MCPVLVQAVMFPGELLQKQAQIQRVVFPTKIAFLSSIFKKFFLPKKDILPGISYPCQS